MTLRSNLFSSTAGAVNPAVARIAPLGVRQAATATPVYGKVHAVPVCEIVGHSGRLAEAIYRAFEFIVAAAGLIVGLPIMLITALLVRCDSPGPALFLHVRPARSDMQLGCELEARIDLLPPPGGYRPDTRYFVPRYFRLVKFRTMHRDARTRYPELYSPDFGPGGFHNSVFKRQDDPRVTRLGRIIRKLSVDELPNLWSVLTGDLRLVGPRPEAPDVLQYYNPDEMYKFACKPGITGLAQINGRNLLTCGDTIRWDLEYVRTRSVALDLKIIVLTLKYVLTRRGAF